MLSADEEALRVLPVIEAVKKHFDIPVSVDTFKSSVAESLIRKIVISSVSFLLPPTVFDDPRTIRCYIGNRKEIIL